MQINGWLAVIVVVVGLGLATVAIATRAEPNQTSEKSESTDTKSIMPMPRERFWAIIAQSLPHEANTDEQSKALKNTLLTLSPADIAAFEATFDDVMRSSYSWDLWGAVYVVHGGASDDGFEYFRCWLISKGQGVFEAVSKDPDSLADMMAGDSSGPLEYEEFAYIARSAWEAKTGKSVDAMPRVANMIYPDLKPTGTPFQEDAPYLAKRYPKLWKRFGHNPAG